MPEGKVGDLVRITDASICNHLLHLHAVYRVIDVDSDGYYLGTVRTSRLCGYVWTRRVEIVRPPIKRTRRLTVIGNRQENDAESKESRCPE